MNRLACINIPWFPLQLAQQQHPDWGTQPAVVVAEDRPGATILFANQAAQSLRIVPGLRYGAALSLHSALHATVISPEQVHQATMRLVHILQNYSPDVEASSQQAGIFWLNATGFERMYDKLQQWIAPVSQELAARSFSTRICVGFNKFLCYAASTVAPKSCIFSSPAREQQVAYQSHLHQLTSYFLPQQRRLLQDLGIQTLGDFCTLKADDVATRFQREISTLLALATAKSNPPLRPAAHYRPLQQTMEFIPLEPHTSGLLFRIRPVLAELLQSLVRQNQHLLLLQLQLQFEHFENIELELEPARHTNDSNILLELLRLRLSQTKLPESLCGAVLTLQGGPQPDGQLQLFAQKPRRDLHEGTLALDRIRAEFGPETVVQAALHDAHLPDQRYHFEPMPQLLSCEESSSTPYNYSIVRRWHASATALYPATYHQSEQQQHSFGTHQQYPGSRNQLRGPVIWQQQWWRCNGKTTRYYYYLTTANNDIAWVYWDPQARQWMLQGILD